jgi:outer membrane lipoprotein-sorting protein
MNRTAGPRLRRWDGDIKKHPASLLIRVLLILAFVCPVLRPAWGAQPQEAKVQLPKASLADILKATGDYCETVKRMALFFICQERIEDHENFFTRGRAASRSSPDALMISRTKRQHFIYDYQIIKKGDEFEERRILLEENGEKRHQENANLATLKVSARNLVFGPVGFLSRYWQKLFVYEIQGEELIDGKIAIIIRAVPNAERKDNNNRGRVWVDASTYQILRIELEPQNAQDAEVLFEGNSPAGTKYRRHFTWTVDYGVEKNGVRFPSRQTIREELLSDTGYKILKCEVLFNYTDYKFFTVEVDIKELP